MPTPGDTTYPCPCCGWMVFAQEPGSYDICPICFWEDDLVQLRWPTLRGGANRPCLLDAQSAYERLGAIEDEFLNHVRDPRSDEESDPRWRPFDPARDEIEEHQSGVDYGKTYSDDRTEYYYWRS